MMKENATLLMCVCVVVVRLKTDNFIDLIN